MPSKSKYLLPIGLFLALLIIAGIAFSYYSYRQQWSRVQERLNRYGLQLDMDGAQWSLSGLNIPFMEFHGPDRMVIIRDLNLSPSLSIHRDQSLVGLKLQAKQIRFQIRLPEGESPSPGYDSENDDGRVNHDDLIQQFLSFTGLISQLQIQNVTGEIFEQSGRLLYSIRDLELELSSQQGALDYRLSQASYRHRSFLENLEGTVIFDGDGEYFPFLVANGSGLEKNWEGKGHISRNLRKLSIFVKSQGIPAEWRSALGPYLPNQDEINYALRLQVERKKNLEASFDIQFGSTNFTFYHEKIADVPIGPVPFRSRIFGSLLEGSGAVELQGILQLLDGQNTSNQTQLQFSARKSDILSNQEGDPWYTQFHLPATSCQSIQAILPTAILGELKNLDVVGELGFQSKLKIPVTDLSAFQFSFDQFRYDCNLRSSVPTYSNRFLRTRDPGQGLDQLTMTPQLRALLSPRYTTNLGAYLPLLLVAAEDTGFWSHQGIEFSALEAALRHNLKHGRIAVGGSTITMQTAKNLYLSPERTLVRKFQELIHAKHLEDILTKQEILTVYANIIEFGPDLYGIQNASLVFFGRPIHELNANEVLYLSSILPSPRTALINYCQRHVGERSSMRMRQVYERFENLRPTSVPRFEFNPQALQFKLSRTYVQRYCPMTLAQPIGGNR